MEGAEFGRYRLIELLGRGGMGEVWRAFDTGTNRDVAIKVLPTQLAEDPAFEARFRREADLAARVSNPHIVPIYDFGEIDGRLFVSMRLVEGHDLATEITNGALAPERAVLMIEQVAKALRAAHRAGLIHRDVKPSNILIDEDDNAYLIDFGIARAAADTGLTGTGTTIGTWAYMAPERFHGDELDARVDVYALACVLYESLTGAVPYPGSRFEKVAAGHMFSAPPRPTLVRAGLPMDFDHVIAIGMAKDPNHRYPGTRELAEAARSALTPPALTMPNPPSPPTVAATSEPYRSRTPYPAVQSAHPAPAATSPRRRTLLVSISAAVAIVVAVVAIIANTVARDDSSVQAGTSTTDANADAPTSEGRGGYGQQEVLPFADLSAPDGVAVDRTGAVSVTNQYGGDVVALTPGSRAGTVLPFTGLSLPSGVAVDRSGAVYVADSGNKRVIKVEPDTGQQTVLPFTDLDLVHGVAVDATGAVYVTDYQSGANAFTRVVKLEPDTGRQTDLRFADASSTTGIAVDAAGAVYITDMPKDRVVKLAPDTGRETVLPFTGLNKPVALAVDTNGDVYVADSDNNRIVMVASDSRDQTVIPFTGLQRPFGIAVDTVGAVYVADTGNHRVLKLPRADSTG